MTLYATLKTILDLPDHIKEKIHDPYPSHDEHPDYPSFLQFHQATDLLEEKQHYRLLSPDEGLALLPLMLQLQARGFPELAGKMCSRLANFHPHLLDGWHSRLLQAHIGTRSYIVLTCYRDAPSDVRDRLIACLEEEENASELPRDKALLALVWIGDQVVRDHLLRLGSDPMSFPPIAKRFHASFWHPEVKEEAIERYKQGILGYSEIAGWELLPDGQRRELTFPHAYSLIPEASPSSPVKLMHWNDLDEVCPVCHQPLQCFLEIDLSVPSLSWIPLPGSRWILPACVRCFTESFFQTWDMIWQARSSVDALWSFRISRDLLQWTDSPFDSTEEDRTIMRQEHAFSLGNERQTFYEEIGPVLYSRETVLGGFPGWVQGSEYPPCPQCEHPMPFLLQVPLNFPNVECMGYVHICTNCFIAQLITQID